jgi:hypothetical protein
VGGARLRVLISKQQGNVLERHCVAARKVLERPKNDRASPAGIGQEKGFST